MLFNCKWRKQQFLSHRVWEFNGIFYINHGGQSLTHNKHSKVLTNIMLDKLLWVHILFKIQLKCQLLQVKSISGFSHFTGSSSQKFIKDMNAPSMEFSRQEYWSGLPSLIQRIFPTQGLNLGFLHCRQILYHLSHQGSPILSLQIILIALSMYLHYSSICIMPKLLTHLSPFYTEGWENRKHN